MQKILILQDLGIPQEKFDELISKIGLQNEFVRDDLDSDNIIGIITIKSRVDESLLDKLPNVKFVAVAFTGYDAVDLESAKRRNIKVFNVPTYATDCTAELAAGLAISLLREIPKGHQITMSGGWDIRPGNELAGKTVGIIGTGSIGIRTAELFKAFKCNLIGWSRTERAEFTNLGGTYKNAITDVFREADIVSVHLLLNDSTKEIIGTREFSVMKKTAYFINVARGPIVKTNDLADALKSNTLAGAAIDVFDVEPIEQSNPLLKAPNIILTPHIAYKTEESFLRRAEITLQNIKAFSEGSPQNVV
ncbi:MAG: NAD(P)-dependent oxidoreductase [Microgenomates group bacterium]